MVYAILTPVSLSTVSYDGTHGTAAGHFLSGNKTESFYAELFAPDQVQFLEGFIVFYCGDCIPLTLSEFKGLEFWKKY